MHQVSLVPHSSEIWFNRNFSLIKSLFLHKLVVLTRHNTTAAFSSFLLLTLLPPTHARPFLSWALPPQELSQQEMLDLLRGATIKCTA